MMKHWSKPGLPGLSVEEVQQAAKRINKLSGLVALVSMIVAQLISEHDFTLIQTIDKLEDDLQKRRRDEGRHDHHDQDRREGLVGQEPRAPTDIGED